MITVELKPKKEEILSGPSYNLLKSKLEVFLNQNDKSWGGPFYRENGEWKCKVTSYPTPKIMAEA